MTSLNCDDLRTQHNISHVNTGKRFTILGPSGIVTDDLERLHPILDPEGQVVFRSGVEFHPLVFRGQNAIHSPCVPTIARTANPVEQFLQWCRNVAFVDALLEHPYVQHCMSVTLGGSPLRIHCQSIAQHYGLATNLLDTTNNFDVAAFFASCTPGADGQWRPVMEVDKPGVIYAFPPILFHLEPNGFDRCFDVGWQPLQRPEQQRASAMQLFKGEDFAAIPGVAAWAFRHDRAIAERLLEQFNGGAALFPVDPASDIATRANQLMTFTESQIEQAFAAYDAWHGVKLETEQRQELVSVAGISRAEDRVLSWDEFNLDTQPVALRQRLERELAGARYRLTCDHFVAC